MEESTGDMHTLVEKCSYMNHVYILCSYLREIVSVSVHKTLLDATSLNDVMTSFDPRDLLPGRWLPYFVHLRGG